jgi:Ca2+-binding EF-hand superfamily protein
VQIFDLFDVKKKGVIDFDDFVRSLNVFHPNAALEDKIDCELKIGSSTHCSLPSIPYFDPAVLIY